MKSVFVVGLDGATWKVLNPLIKSKKLPFLQNLMEKSAYGVLHSTIPPLSAPAWVTFQTGVNPGKHSIFEFLNYRTSDGSPRLNTSIDIKSATIWEILAEYNLNSLVINMPLSYPLKKMKGIIISSFLTPVGATFTYPKSVEKDLIKIGYEIDLLVDKTYGLMPDKKLNARERKFYLKRLLEISMKRISAYKLLANAGIYSFQFLLFKECDVAQHLFWGLPELNQFYMSLDSMLGDLYEEYQKQEGEKNFILISDHGFHNAARKQFSPYVFLEEYLKRKDNLSLSKSIWKISSVINRRLRKYGFFPTQISFIKRIRSILLDKGRKEKTKNNKITPTLFGLFLNEVNQKERLTLSKEIISKLKDLNNKFKIFDSIFTPGEFYKGPYIRNMPDIVWKVNEGYTIDTSPFAEELITPRESRLRGDHEADPDGIFIASGKLIKKGASDNENIENIPLVTLKLLGLSIPWFFDGKLPKFYIDEINMNYRKIVKDIIDNEIGFIEK